jgi:hypothetical protein
MSTRNTPPKNSHAASQLATIASSVVVNVSHTNMCREYTVVKINACATRRRPVCESKIIPSRAKSIWALLTGLAVCHLHRRLTAAALVVGALHTEPMQRAMTAAGGEGRSRSLGRMSRSPFDLLGSDRRSWHHRRRGQQNGPSADSGRTSHGLVGQGSRLQ